MLLCFSETRRFFFYKAHCSEKRGVLWLASYPVRCDWPNTSNLLKPTINEAFVASTGDIITDYNDLYSLFARRVASRHVNMTMSAFVIGETANNKHYSTRLKTRVWIVSGKFFK